jgi:potassium efflux system protein
VRDLLLTTASSHPDVLDFPKPTVLFLGFGPYTLNFEVRFWVGRPEIVLDLQSEVTLRIAAALNEAGIDMPAPLGKLLMTTSGQSGAGQTKAATVVKNA